MLRWIFGAAPEPPADYDFAVNTYCRLDKSLRTATEELSEREALKRRRQKLFFTLLQTQYDITPDVCGSKLN